MWTSALFDLGLSVGDFSNENSAQTFARFGGAGVTAAAVGQLLFEFALADVIDDPTWICCLVRMLTISRKRFLLKQIDAVFGTFPKDQSERSFGEVFHAVVSAAVDEVISQTDGFRKPQIGPNAVVRDLLDAIGPEQFAVDPRLIGGSERSWEQTVK
jgi:hypothetical protein